MTFIQLLDEGWVDCSGDEPSLHLATIDGIYGALRLINRYTGNTPRPYSVAEHSVLVARVAEKLGFGVRYALLHDASEIVTSDIPGPLKRYLPGLKGIEAGFMTQILGRFGVLADSRIKAIDKAAVYFEVRFLGMLDNRWTEYFLCNPIDPDIYEAYKQILLEPSCHFFDLWSRH